MLKPVAARGSVGDPVPADGGRRRLGLRGMIGVVVVAVAVASCDGNATWPTREMAADLADRAYEFRWVGQTVGDGKAVELHVEGVFDAGTRSGTAEAQYDGDTRLFSRERIADGRGYISIAPDSIFGPSLAFDLDQCAGKSWMHVLLFDAIGADELGDLLHTAMRPDPGLLTAVLADDADGFVRDGTESIRGKATDRYEARSEYLRGEGRDLVVTDEVGDDADAFLEELTLWIDGDGRLRRASWTGGGDIDDEHGTLDIIEYDVRNAATGPPAPESTCLWR